MFKGIMNLVYVKKVPIYINELSAWCAAPVVVQSYSRTYKELTLYLKIIRWLHELLRPNETTSFNQSINNYPLTTCKNLQYI